VLDASVPDASAVAGRLPLPAAMLDLKITRCHVRVRFDRLGRILLATLDVVFVDDLKRERVEDYLFEFFIDARRMVGWDEAHLLREWEVEKEDTTMRAITRLIVDVPIKAHAPPGMSAVYLLKLLIHIPQYENGN
jgi:hypothetical protein